MFTTSSIIIGLVIVSVSFIIRFLFDLFQNKREIIKDDVVLITGAAGGVGVHLSEKFAKLGCTLILIDREEDKLNALKESLVAKYKNVVHVAGIDLSDYKKVTDFLVRMCGCVSPITIAIHNAAITRFMPMNNHSIKDYEAIMSVNVTAFVNIVNSVFPEMLKKNHGNIVAVSSMLSLMGTSTLGAYSASKAALARLMETLQDEAHEAGKQGIKFTTIFPVKIDTELFKQLKFKNYTEWILPVLSPEHVAESIIDGIKKERTSVYLPLYIFLVYGLLPKSVIFILVRLFKQTPPEQVRS